MSPNSCRSSPRAEYLSRRSMFFLLNEGKTWMPGMGLHSGRPKGRTRVARHDDGENLPWRNLDQLRQLFPSQLCSGELQRHGVFHNHVEPDDLVRLDRRRREKVVA